VRVSLASDSLDTHAAELTVAERIPQCGKIPAAPPFTIVPGALCLADGTDFNAHGAARLAAGTTGWIRKEK